VHVIAVRGERLSMMWRGRWRLHEPLRRVERMAVMPVIVTDNSTESWIDAGEGGFGGCG
jgi:hypothetical protein